MVCGLPAALSAIITDALSAAASEGVKVIPIVQFPPATTELPQLSAVSEKSLELAPPIDRPVMLKAALPVLLRVVVNKELATATGTFPKARLVGDRLTPGLVPVPERVTVCGLPLALSAILTAAVNDPLAAGVKVTLIAQLEPAATLAPQVLLCSKSLGFAPVRVTPVRLKATLPVLLKVMACDELATPTGSFPKLRLPGNRLTPGLVPVPERVTVCGLPLALSATLTAAVNEPLAAGVNVTLIVHLPPAATLDPQLLVCEKSLELVPVIPMLVMLKAALPVLLRVTV